ncbi:MAG: phage major capsid protein [Oscillospiraceae bacterium]|jgi:HK97 family phage major capsid protein|nr:phage major capsid protein [Oscillospiraceae bacterium]
MNLKLEMQTRIAEIRARKTEIRSSLDTADNATLDLFSAEIGELDTELANLEKRMAILNSVSPATSATLPAIANPVSRAGKTQEINPEESYKTPEYRSAWIKTLQGKTLNEAEYRAYSTAADSAAPIIPETTANAIVKKMYEVSPILQRCKIYHVPGTFKFSVEDTRDEATLHTENAATTTANDNLRVVTLAGYEIIKIVSASAASTAMALSAFESYIVDALAEDIARKLENYIFNGNGTSEPGGVSTAGKGTGGAYIEGTDLLTVTAAPTEANVIAAYGMLGSGYERNAVWCMSKSTFFASYYSLMNKSKNNLIEFAGGKYYIMGAEVYFTGSLAAGVAYYGDFSYIFGNFSQDIVVEKSKESGFRNNAIDYRGTCVFDSKPIDKLGAFIKLVISTTAA